MDYQKKGVRELGYNFAVGLKNVIPSLWNKHKIAGEEWLRHFFSRHQSKLPLRKPEATSLSRAISSNRQNVAQFFRNVEVHTRYENFLPQNIYNIDETGLTTVQNPQKIIARKGKRQVGAITSAEHGTLISCVAGINAIRNHLPPS